MKNLIRMRERRGYTRRQMADLLNVTVQTYCRYEADVRQPSFATVKKIAEILRTDPQSLLDTELSQKSGRIRAIKRPQSPSPTVRIITKDVFISEENIKILENQFSDIITEFNREKSTKKLIKQQIAEWKSEIKAEEKA